MNPSLVLLQDGTRWEISGKVVTIGGASDCHINLRQLPARAAHLLFSQGAYRLQKLHKEVRVAVNDKQPDASGVELCHNDVITIGSQQFRFLHDHLENIPNVEQASDSGDTAKLRDLINIAVNLLQSRDETLFDSLVANFCRLLRCDGARLVIYDATSDTRKTIARFPNAVGLDRFSNRAIDWARDAGRTILMHEDEWRTPTSHGESLEKNLIASIMCAPLSLGEKEQGYLYLDRISKASPFTDDDRRFCDALLPLFSGILANFHEKQQQQATIARLQKQSAPSGGILFESACMSQLVNLAQRLAKTDSPVLITGETGTGKELLARFVHDNSSRAGGIYKAINCGAIPENLIESELFGHEKGAFTGAVARKTGLFEAANGGTVFLDEIGEMPLHLQVRLLRTLQESEVVRVGGTETIPVNVRIIAATNRDLENEVNGGTFRQDLYFRLNVLTLHLPPLRQRGDDIILLAEVFINRYCQQFGLAHKTLTSASRNLLISHLWPGNIRELENVIQKTVLLCEADKLTPDDFQLGKTGARLQAIGNDKIITLKDARAEAERQVIITTLIKTHGNVSMAGKILDIDRKWLIKKMEELAIDADTYRT